jgi:uncharacterized protein YjbI with pentapeptide repeats
LGANLDNANLQNADFSNAYLVSVSLKCSIYDQRTIWPENFDPAAAGAEKEIGP